MIPRPGGTRFRRRRHDLQTDRAFDTVLPLQAQAAAIVASAGKTLPYLPAIDSRNRRTSSL